MPPRAVKGEKNRAYLFWGQEETRKRQALDELIETLVPAEDRDLDVEYVDATNAGVTAETILHAARDRAMFSERRVVVVQNAHRFRGQRFQKVQETLAQGIATLPEYATLVLYAGAEDGGQRGSPFNEKLTASAKAHGAVKQFPLLKPEELAHLAASEAAAAGKKLLPAAASMIAQRSGPSSIQVLQEVRKLISYVGDSNSITPREVDLLIPAPPDDNIFKMLDAAMDGNRKVAIDTLHDLRESGTAVPQVLTMLTRSIRQVLQAKFLHSRRVSPEAERDQVPEEILALLPAEGSIYDTARSSWQRKKLWNQAARFTWERLHRAHDGLVSTDAGTKGWEFGVDDPDLALELYVINLCEG